MRDAEKARKLEEEKQKEKERDKQEHEKGNIGNDMSYNFFIANVMFGCRDVCIKVYESSAMVFTAFWPFNVGVLMEILQKILPLIFDKCHYH
jgi:hypothetical protein